MSSEATAVNSTNSVDIDKLLVSVQNHPLIYDTALKDHHNADVINTIWTEIGKELGVPGYACKAKWVVLRNSYARHLRDVRKMSSSSAQNKRKWYLADAMEFLRPFTVSFRQMTSSLKPAIQMEESETTPSQQQDDPSPSNDLLKPSIGARCKQMPRKKVKKTPADVVASPVIDFPKTATEKRLRETSQQTDIAMMCFFKSLLPDIESLSVRRQCQFKTTVMASLNDLIDQEENDAQCSLSTYSASGSSHLFLDNPQVHSEGDIPTYHNLYQ